MKFATIILSFFVTTSMAQSKQDYVWLFGQGVSSTTGEQRGYKFDFNQQPYELEHQDIPIPIADNNASICDVEGNLLFFTNGCEIYNSQFELMENGDSLNYDEWISVFGGDCSFGYIGGQDIMIIPDPSIDPYYYVIHKTFILNGLNEKDSIPIKFSIVDMSANNGLGKVIEKNVRLYNDGVCLINYLTGIHHTNGSDFWFLQPIADDSVIVTYQINENGIERFPDQNSHQFFERGKSSASGTAKFSPDGTQYAIYNETDGLLLYDFDRDFGKLSFREKLITFDTTGIGIFCSVEWSSNSRFIYTATKTKLHQVDTREFNIQQNGIRLIDTYDGTQDPFSTTFYLMAQAPDCKIYMCPTNGTNSYHVINDPDQLGTACNFVQNGIILPHSSNFGNMPNFPRFRVDEEAKCDPTIVSVFGNAVHYRRELEVYPSPSTGRFIVQLPKEISNGRMVVTDMKAQVLRDIQINEMTFDGEIKIFDLPRGIYNIEIYPSDNKERIFYSKQVMKF